MKQRHYLWCLLVAGIVGVIFYWHKSDNVFPAASIDLRLSRNQITDIAKQWATKLGYTEKDPKISTVFSFDDDAKTFLEYELGLTKANQLMRTTVPTWYWSTRFLEPLKQEEFTTWISPDGRLTSFEHDIENDRKMKSIGHADAEKLARDFIQNQGNVSLDGTKITDQGSISQLHRTDHYFTFEDTKESFNGAKLRSHIYISGDQVTAYNHYLYVPETWTRRFSKLRSYNLALEDAASIFYVALNTGTFFVFLWAFASGRIRWRLSLTVASIYAVISLLESLNSWPSSIHEYNTSLPYAGFELEFAISTLTAAVTSFLQILVLVAAAETIYRLSFPNAVSLEKLFTEAGLRCRRTLYGIGAGLATFGIHLGWIAAFYLVGRQYGFWCPLEIQNVETLSTAQPFFSAMQVGWLASLTEEMTYRIIGLAAFRKLVKNFWVANLLQAAAWGFMHSNYPQEPPYARGLELTIAGFFYGTILRYFGLLPCIFSHNLLDTFLGLQPLLTSNIGHMKASAYIGLAPFAILIAISLFLVKRRGFTEDEETIHNQTVTQSHPPITDTVENILPSGYLYEPLSAKMRWLMGVVLVAGAAINFFFFAPSVGRTVKLRLNRDEAIGIAHQYLLQQGIRPDGLTTVAMLEGGLDAEQMQYIYEKDKSRVRELALKPEFPLLWSVRFVKPLVQDEYRVIEDSSGHPLAMTVTKPEKEAGANLPKEDARKKVEAFLNTDHEEIKPYERIEGEDNESKKENRTDYTFQFKVPSYRVADADYRVNTGMVGDQVSGFEHGWLIPDDWKFERSKQRMHQIIWGYVVWAFYIVCVILGILWARGVIRSRAIVWRPAIMLAAGLIVVSVAQSLNELPVFYYDYSTETPLISFFVSRAGQMFMGWISSFGFIAGLSAFGLASLKLLLPKSSVSAIVKTTFAATTAEERQAKYNLWIDATLVGLAAGLGQRAIPILLGTLHVYLSPVVSMAPLEGFCRLVNVSNPTIATALEAFSYGFYYVFVAAIMVGIYAKYIRRFNHYVIFAILSSLLLPSAERYWQDYLLNVASYLSTFAFTYVLVTKLAKENLLAYFIMGGVSVIAGAIRLLGSFGKPVFLEDVAALGAMLLAPAIYILFLRANLSRGQTAPIIDPVEPPEPHASHSDSASSGSAIDKRSEEN